MIKYKLTDRNMRTHNGCQWAVGKPRITDGSGGLCGPGYMHYYHHPLLAVLLNSIHANIPDPLLWEVRATGKHLDDNGLKGGCTWMVITRELPLPVVTTEQRIRFGILCALEVYREPSFIAWAEKWLSGEDRSREAAAYAAAYAADSAAAARAGWAAAAYAAADSAAAGAAAGWAAAGAAAEADFDLVAVAVKACGIEQGE